MALLVIVAVIVGGLLVISLFPYKLAGAIANRVPSRHSRTALFCTGAVAAATIAWAFYAMEALSGRPRLAMGSGMCPNLANAPSFGSLIVPLLVGNVAACAGAGWAAEARWRSWAIILACATTALTVIAALSLFTVSFCDPS